MCLLAHELLRISVKVSIGTAGLPTDGGQRDVQVTKCMPIKLNQTNATSSLSNFGVANVTKVSSTRRILAHHTSTCSSGTSVISSSRLR